MPPRTSPGVGRRVQICMPPSTDYIRDIVMPPLRGSTPHESIMAKMDYIWTALDKLESRKDATDRRLEGLRPPQRPDPEPPYRFRNGGGAYWNRQYQRYTQPTHRQPQHQKPNRYLSQPPYQLDRPARHPSGWDKLHARVPMSSLIYEASESTYYSNNDWDFDDYEESASDSDGYDEDFNVGYSRQPYHQLHSMMPQRPSYFTGDSYLQTQSSNPYSHRRTTHSNGQPWPKDRPLLPRSTSCCHPTTQLRQAVARLEQPVAEQQPLFQRPPWCQHPLSGTIDEDKDFRGEGKRGDEDLCYETELIPIHHSSSLDQELDAHHKMEKNNSLNWMGNFLDEVDGSKSSLLDDNHDKATFEDEEFTEMECHSVKMSDDSDLQGDSSQQKCLDSDDDYEDDRVDSEERRSYNLTAAGIQLLKVLVQRFMEDKQFGGRRNDADVRSRCMIRSLLQVPAIKDDFVKTKVREERDEVEMLHMFRNLVSIMKLALEEIAKVKTTNSYCLLLSVKQRSTVASKETLATEQRRESEKHDQTSPNDRSSLVLPPTPSAMLSLHLAVHAFAIDSIPSEFDGDRWISKIHNFL
ncbi:hypothetical protein SASPL_150197 [Salvia splendens]|uniref:Uncharacterized protein n=1 Tax=Salvia splendens TaxID=180675 RepID=A0A8X8W5R7_SALSN|nr:hypothetical protein SASPL_150197 [Salvia splendens]